MDFDFSSARFPRPNLSIRLHAIYCLRADSSYDVQKKLSNNEEWVVLRTMAGEGCVKLEGCPEMMVGAGTLLYFRHQDAKRYYCSGDHWHFFWFEFLCEEQLGFPVNTIVPVHSLDHEQEDCRTCLHLLRSEKQDAGAQASAYLCLLFYQWQQSLGVREKKNPYHERIQQILLDLNDSPDSHVTVKSLAGKTGLCERRFRQVFEQETGVTPKKYLEVRKLKLAEALLMNTSLRVGEIAERLGYCNPFHFSRRFQAMHGVPPSHFRK